VVTKERFAQGMTPTQYLDQMGMNRERFAAAMQAISITDGEARLLDRWPGTRRMLVITEDWCGTAIASVPFVFKLAERVPGVETRVFLRDENPDLMDQYLKNGMYRSIPVIALFDEDMNELARFIERRPG